MRLRAWVMAAALAGLAIGQANAQYYPPPEAYGPPGSRCNAFRRTPYGPRQIVCPMGLAKPVGAPCACPAPGPYGRPAHGRVIP